MSLLATGTDRIDHKEEPFRENSLLMALGCKEEQKWLRM